MPGKHHIPGDFRLEHVDQAQRDVLRKHARAAARMMKDGKAELYECYATEANELFSKWERGYWTAWRDSELARLKNGG